jgi:hypothetical protein
MIIFLDFDGVLHPDPCTPSQAFCHLSHFEAVLIDYPNINVVISSSWRRLKSINQLREYFSIELRHRILGMTPFLSEGDHMRGKECELWLRLQKKDEEEWLAIDDKSNNFEDWISGQLYLTKSEIGLDDAAISSLRKIIQRDFKID